MTGAQLFNTDEPILEFRGEHRFLSNFYVHEPLVLGAPWWMEGSVFPSVEHAYQAAKVEPGTTGFVEHYNRIAKAGLDQFGQGSPDPGRAKFLGSVAGFQQHDAVVRGSWDQVKVPVMLACLRAKFPLVLNWDGPNDVPLWRSLAATSPRVLVEGNTWGDTYWGVCGGKGKNMLGRLLMLVRAELLCARAAGLRVEDLR